jgi:hypothetical protein
MTTQGVNRRQWLSRSAAAGLAGWLATQVTETTAGPKLGEEDRAKSGPNYRLFFGDLHNHNSVGYAQGSLERTYEIARNHLDFFAFTPHGWWHDIGHYENGIEQKWLDGFEVTRRRWPDVMELVRRYHEPGTFVTIPGWEWHSRSLGDYHILFPSEEAAEYIRFDDLRRFQQFARERRAIMIPHHPGNIVGHRGANIKYLDPEVSPLLVAMSSRKGASKRK